VGFPDSISQCGNVSVLVKNCIFLQNEGKFMFSSLNYVGRASIAISQLTSRLDQMMPGELLLEDYDRSTTLGSHWMILRCGIAYWLNLAAADLIGRNSHAATLIS
jgi:hypothetical protein